MVVYHQRNDVFHRDMKIDHWILLDLYDDFRSLKICDNPLLHKKIQVLSAISKEVCM